MYIPTYMQALVCLCTCHTYIYMQKKYIFFIHSPVHEYIDCFYFLAAVNSCYEYGYIKVSVHAFCLLRMCPEVGLLSHMVILFLIFEELPYSDCMIKHLQCKTILISLYAHHHVLHGFCFGPV